MILVVLLVGVASCSREPESTEATASSAERSPPASCGETFDEMVAMSRAMDVWAGGETPAPDRHEFMELCHQLPVEVRRCFSIGYAYDHQPDCEHAIDALPSNTRTRLREVTGSHHG